MTHPINAPTDVIPSEANSPTPPFLPEALLHHLDLYFANLGTQSPSTNLYQMVVQQAEETLLVTLLEKAHYHQGQVSEWLGLSRATTRRMMKQYRLLD